MKVFVYGDSHAGKFGGRPDKFILHDAQQATAHNIINPNSQMQSWFSLQQALYRFNAEEDIFMFCLGEIDCRIHFYRQHIITGRTYEKLINDTVKRYGHIIKTVRDDGRMVAVLDAPPAVAQENDFGYDYYGSRDERAKIIFLWNHILGDWCRANNICFVNLHQYITDERGWLKEEYSVGDGAHVTSDVVPFVLDELAKYWPDVLCE